MKTTMMAGVCLLALVLTFTIAEGGHSQGKRQDQQPTSSPLCQESYATGIRLSAHITPSGTPTNLEHAQ